MQRFVGPHTVEDITGNGRVAHGLNVASAGVMHGKAFGRFAAGLGVRSVDAGRVVGRSTVHSMASRHACPAVALGVATTQSVLSSNMLGACCA